MLFSVQFLAKDIKMIHCLMVDDDRFYSAEPIANESVIYLTGIAVQDVHIARDYWSAIDFIEQKGIPDVLTMDNDIASFDEQGKEFKGYDFVKWLCEQVMDGKYTFPENFKFNAHTANIVDQKAMLGYMQNFFAQFLQRKLITL